MKEQLNLKKLVFVSMIYILAFQSPLQTYVWDKFSYIDEFVVLIGGIGFLRSWMRKQINKISKETYLLLFMLTVFGITGWIGNLIYQYQPWRVVVIDFITNFKFFFAILAGYFLFTDISWEDMKRCTNIHTKCVTLVLSSMFVVDRIFDIFGGHIRYGIKSNTLIYEHPTYVAAALVFVIVLQIIFYEEKNLPYFSFNIIMMIFTMRFKAIATAVVFAGLFVYVILKKGRITKRIWIAVGFTILSIGMPMIYFFYVKFAGWSARSVMTQTAFRIVKDYFPIGTGFGTYASYIAGKYYSPVYEKYGFLDIPEVLPTSHFLSDTFWPIILGQTGCIGTVCYLMVLIILLRKAYKLERVNYHMYLGMVYTFIYLFISSTAEPTFNNAMSVPLAVTMGIVFRKYDRGKGSIYENINN